MAESRSAEAILENGEVTLVTKPKEEREQWRRKFDFLIACMGFSIGLGNVWRFPYLCYKNGGGAFLLPYFISVFIVGIPLFLLEVSLGQLTSRGAIAAWDICPLFRGIGCASTLINFLVNTYYTVILAWTLHFLFASFASQLPWTLCGQWWNTASCSLDGNRNGSASASAGGVGGEMAVNNSTTWSPCRSLLSDPATEYWENRVLGISKGIEYGGSVRWDLALCLLLAWLLIFLCIYNGIKTSSKVMYFTALAPYLLMLILVVRTALLPGSTDGLTYYLKPNWVKLGEMTVWSDAGTQIFFSYAISLGALTALGSYNSFHHNAVRDCFFFALINTFTSLIAGCVIFATLGNMSLTSGIPIDDVAESGPGLAFVIYPKALGTMPGSPFWAVCFFLMMLLLGIDSMFGGVEGFVVAISDFLPHVWAQKRIRVLLVGTVCVCSYLIGLSMVTNGGMYVFQLFDCYSGSRIVVAVGFLETVVISYCYGIRRFSRDLRVMFGFSLGWVPLVFWGIITPVFTLILFVFSIIVYEQLTYKRASLIEPYRFPAWSVKLGWLMASSSLLLIPVFMVIQVARTPGSFLERIKYLLESKFPDTALLRDETHEENLSNGENAHLIDSVINSAVLPKTLPTD